MPTPDEDYEKAVALLGVALPLVAKALRGAKPKSRAPLTNSQLRRLARTIWDHGFEHGRAHELEQGAKRLRDEAEAQDQHGETD